MEEKINVGKLHDIILKLSKVISLNISLLETMYNECNYKCDHDSLNLYKYIESMLKCMILNLIDSNELLFFNDMIKNLLSSAYLNKDTTKQEVLKTIIYEYFKNNELSFKENIDKIKIIHIFINIIAHTEIEIELYKNKLNSINRIYENENVYNQLIKLLENSLNEINML